MVDWPAALNGKSKEDIVSQLSPFLSQLPHAQQQQALQQLGPGNLIAQPPPPPAAPTWRLVILNNKSMTGDPRLGWLKNWPHELEHQRQSGTPGDNTLILVKNILTRVRVGLIPLGVHNSGPNQPPERVTISLHRAPAPTGPEITAAATAGVCLARDVASKRSEAL